jgi:ornithine cyclodeaminase/alanine dehydrogenase-like protein (mu-crystallin family)
MNGTVRLGRATIYHARHRLEDVAATLAQLASGTKPGRKHDDIVIFDSTGTGVQDVAVSAAAYETVHRGPNAHFYWVQI